MAAPIYQLTMRSGPNPGQTFPIEQEEMVLGRDLTNDIPISDPEVSRRHARFIMQDDNLIVEDLGSTNGTFLNGQRVSNPQQLRAGDVITFGESIVMVFEKTSYDPDATVVSSQAPPTVQSAPHQQAPAPSSYQRPPEPPAYQQPQQTPVAYTPQPPIPGEKKKGGFPTWLIVLIIAIVVIACVIAVTMWFMPASWWCAITFNMLEGCPIP